MDLNNLGNLHHHPLKRITKQEKAETGRNYICSMCLFRNDENGVLYCDECKFVACRECLHNYEDTELIGRTCKAGHQLKFGACKHDTKLRDKKF